MVEIHYLSTNLHPCSRFGKENGRAREAFASVREPVAAFVRAERDAGRVPAGLDPDAVGRLVISLLAGLVLQRALDEEVDLDAYRGAVRAFLGKV